MPTRIVYRNPYLNIVPYFSHQSGILFKGGAPKCLILQKGTFLFNVSIAHFHIRPRILVENNSAYGARISLQVGELSVYVLLLPLVLSTYTYNSQFQCILLSYLPLRICSVVRGGFAPRIFPFVYAAESPHKWLRQYQIRAPVLQTYR